MDYEDVLSSSCDYGCLQDTFTVKWYLLLIQRLVYVHSLLTLV